MIRSLRQRHRVIVIALSVVVPTAFAAAIAIRREVPTLTAPAPGVTRRTGNPAELWTRDDLWPQGPIRTRLVRDSAGAGPPALQLIPPHEIVRPDLLLYWVPGEHDVRVSLPDNAFLLGPLDQSGQTSLPLPIGAANRMGVLVLYSLADHEIVAVSKLFSPK